MDRAQALANSPQYYQQYISKIPEGNILATLNRQLAGCHTFFMNIPEDKWEYHYAEGKWTIKEVLGHINDCERIFGYRALRIARKDATAIPGFEQDEYVASANFNARTGMDLLEEFDLIRRSNVQMLIALPEEAFARLGTASDLVISVGAITWLLAGHVEPHNRVLAEC